MTTRITFAVGGFAALGLLAILSSFMFSPVRDARANPYTATVIGTATTSAAVTVTSSTRLLATTTSVKGISYTRVYATICNPSTTLVYVNMNNDKPANTSSANVVIAAAAGYNACFEITDRNLYSGSIQASSTNQTSTSVIVSEYVQ